MLVLTVALVYIIGLVHIGIMGLEMFAKPATQADAFEMPLDFVQTPNARKALQNQGIYNGMLGLTIIVTNFLLTGSAWMVVQLMLMLFIFVVGLLGALTVTRKIWYMQVIPALIIFLLVLWVG